MIIGHSEQRALVARDVKSGRAAHAYLFAGLQSLGKATLAREFAQHLFCSQKGEGPCQNCQACTSFQAGLHPDYFVLNPDEDGRITIESVRGFRSQLFSTGFLGQVKVAVIDGVDGLTASSASTLLKILEEPPLQTHLILIAHRPDLVLPTLRSRARIIRFAPVAREILQNHLQQNFPDLRSLEDYLDLADGRPGILFRLVQDESEAEKWFEARDVGQKLLAQPAARRLHQLEKLTANYLTRDGVKFLLDILKNEIRRQLRLSELRWLGSIQPLVEAERALLYNTSPRLVLEWLSLNLL